MKKSIALLLLISVFALALIGCQQKEEYSDLSEAIENTNSKERYSANFLAEFTFDNDLVTLLFAQGFYSVDRDKNLLYSEFVQTHLGHSGRYTEICKDGYVYADLDGEKNRYKKNTAEHLEYIYYSTALNFKYEDIDHLKTAENSDGTLYSFTVNGDYDDKLMTMLGEGIYSTAQIKKPQKEKTRFGEIKCEYNLTEDENGIKTLLSRQIVFKVYLYDTPPYSPTYTPPEEDYMLELKVRFKLSYKDFGEAVSIPEPDTEQYKPVE